MAFEGCAVLPRSLSRQGRQVRQGFGIEKIPKPKIPLAILAALGALGGKKIFTGKTTHQLAETRRAEISLTEIDRDAYSF